jgi:hypothetical protein
MKSLNADDTLNERLFFNETDVFEKGALSSSPDVKDIRFGSSFIDFLAPSKTSLAGFGGISRRLLPPQLSGADGFFTYCKPYERVDLNPRIKVTLWTQGQKEVFAIISLDVVAVPADVSRKIVEILQIKFPNFAWHQGNVQIVASHTHSGPAGLTENPFWSVFACDRYSKPLWEFFEEKTVEAMQTAFRNAANAQPINTFWIKKENLETFNKSRLPGMEVHKQSLVLAFDETNSPLAKSSSCIATFAIHPTWYGAQSLVLSSDVVGHVEQQMAIENQGKKCVFLNGTVGNADMNSTTTLDDYSHQLAKALLNWQQPGWKKEPLQMNYGARLVTLPKPKPNLKACKVPPVDFLVGAEVLENLPPRTKISYFKIGSVLFLFYPGEPVYNIQKEIEAKIKSKRPDIETVQILALSNDYVGYMVDSTNFEKETLEACSTLYGSEISKVMEDAVLELLDLR